MDDILAKFSAYCFNGIDFNLDGNGGLECSKYTPYPRNWAEKAVGLVYGGCCFYFGAKSLSTHHRKNAKNSKTKTEEKFELIRVILLILTSITWGMELAYKMATQQLIYMLQPCHVLCFLNVVLLAIPPESYPRFSTALFRFLVYFLPGPTVAVLFPVTNTLLLPFEVAVYWLEHFFLLFVPLFYLVFKSRLASMYENSSFVFTMEPFFDPFWPAASIGIWAFYHLCVLLPIGEITLANINATLCPSKTDPFYGPNYRMHAVWHQTLAVVCFGKIFGLLGKRADANEISEENKSRTKSEEIQENEGCSTATIFASVSVDQSSNESHHLHQD